MQIHAIQTGTVAITKSWREGRGSGQGRLLRTLLDREWTEPLPIFAFVIEHPEGVIVVDTGETARVAEPGYFPRWHPLLRFAVREWVEPKQEIGPQLARLGIAPSDVRMVVMTHLHTDHAGGLHHFPDTEILVTPARPRARTRPSRAPPRLPEQPLADVVRPNAARTAADPARPLPAEPAADDRRRRQRCSAPRPHARPGRRAYRGRQPHRLPRRR